MSVEKPHQRGKSVARPIGVLIAILLVLAIVMALVLAVRWCVSPEEPTARSSADYVWLRKEVVTLTATGAAGAATGSATTERVLHGYVYAVYVDYTSGISSTTDVTFAQASPSGTVLALTNYYTDTWYYPTVQQHSSAGATVTAYERALVEGVLTISAAQTTSGTVATVTVFWGQ